MTAHFLSYRHDIDMSHGRRCQFSHMKLFDVFILQFLQDIFDALFKILSEMHVELSLPVFKALVSSA